MLLETKTVEKPWGKDVLPAPFETVSASFGGKRIGERFYEPTVLTDVSDDAEGIEAPFAPHVSWHREEPAAQREHDAFGDGLGPVVARHAEQEDGPEGGRAEHVESRPTASGA